MNINNINIRDILVDNTKIYKSECVTTINGFACMTLSTQNLTFKYKQVAVLHTLFVSVTFYSAACLFDIFSDSLWKYLFLYNSVVGILNVLNKSIYKQ